MKLCIASNNLNKINEFKHLLNDTFDIVSLKEIGCEEEIPEEQDTIEGNSLQKAEYIWNKYHINCFADDTGLEVESLNKEPGVYSARYAGEQRNSEDNITLLLKNLSDKPNRRAQFKTVITLIINGQIHQFEGIASGTILNERKGTNGFGYDSVFEPDGYNKTFAEMTMEEKNPISHRGKAIEKMVLFCNNYKPLNNFNLKIMNISILINR